MLPNESRLSCGRNARGRKEPERQTKRLAGEATQFFLTCERPAASSACYAAVRDLLPALERDRPHGAQRRLFEARGDRDWRTAGAIEDDGNPNDLRAKVWLERYALIG